MIETLLYILFALLLLALIWYVLTLLPLAPRPRVIVFLLVCLVFLLGFLRQFGLLKV